METNIIGTKWDAKIVFKYKVTLYWAKTLQK
jgi:hypothetical protein